MCWELFADNVWYWQVKEAERSWNDALDVAVYGIAAFHCYPCTTPVSCPEFFHADAHESVRVKAISLPVLQPGR